MSDEKKKAMLEAAKVLETPWVATWYESELENKPQAETVACLDAALRNGRLSPHEALSIALLVGFQWNEKFE